MSIIHRTTLNPNKMELLSGWLPTRPWYQGTATVADPVKAGGWRLDDPAGEVGVEFMVVTDGPVTYHVPLTYRSSPLDGQFDAAGDALIGTTEHGVLGKRWVYDGTHDPVLVTTLLAFIQGNATPQAQSISDTTDPTVQANPLSAGTLLPANFTVSDGKNGTLLRIKTEAGDLALSFTRVLRAADEEQAEQAGYVTAPLHSLTSPTPRAVFAIASLQ